MNTTESSSVNVLDRVLLEVERNALRARNGIRMAAGLSRPKLGTTPKDVVWRRGRAELWRYRSAGVRYGPPVVIVHSLVSRSYILDLRPGNSLVEYLVGAGLDVFMLDWGVPDERDADNTLETYVDDALPRALAAVRGETGSREVTLAGYCLGGLIAMVGEPVGPIEVDSSSTRRRPPSPSRRSRSASPSGRGCARPRRRGRPRRGLP